MKLILSISLAFLFSSCGKNPFGPGAQGGLNLFAHFAKQTERPKAVNEEENGKEGAKGTIKEGAAAAKRLAKRGIDTSWIIEKGLNFSGDTLIYYEIVKDKPSEEDKDKLMTGRAEVAFGYNGIKPVTLDQVDTTKITDIYSFHFLGRENKTWKYYQSKENTQIDSLNITVTFSSSSVTDIRPGWTRFWAMNISEYIELGSGDTAYFALDSLDHSKFTQYGGGEFFDAHSGKDSKDESKTFEFELEIVHKNKEGGNPYLRYQDNEGIMHFSLPWGESADSLYFTIQFFPEYWREGNVRKNGPEGPILVKFRHNEKTGEGWVRYYNEDGNEIGQDYS